MPNTRTEHTPEAEILSQGERSARLAIRLSAKVGDANYPNLRKLGRYVFFALCAAGIAVLGYAGCRMVGIGGHYASVVSNIAGIAAFLTLRDMAKTWDLAIYAANEIQIRTDKLTEWRSA